MPDAGVPPPGWESQLAHDLNAANVRVVDEYFDVWAVAEHGQGPWGGYDQGGAFNPFDTALGSPQSGVSGYSGSPYNSIGVMSYSNWPTGRRATVATLQQSNMAPLLQEIRNPNATVSSLESAESATPWGQEPGWPAPGTKPGTGSAAQSGAGGAQLSSWYSFITANPLTEPLTYIGSKLFGGIAGGAVSSAEHDVEEIAWRIALVVVGLVMIIAGFFLAFHDTSTAVTIEQDAPEAAAAAA